MKRIFSPARFILPLIYFFCLHFSPINLNAQGTCFQSPDFPGSARSYCMAATAGHKGYLLLGNELGPVYLNEVWEYDEVTSQWTQKNNFPGTWRMEAFTWSINGDIYLGGGTNGSTCLLDVWKYTPSTDSWVQVDSFPGNNRYQLASFSYNGKGYIAFGRNSCVSGSGSNQFWEYDPVNDAWTQLTSSSVTSIWSRAAVKNDKAIFLNASSTVVTVYDFLTQTWDNSWPAAAGPATSAPLYAANLNGVIHMFNQNYPKYLHDASKTWFRGDTLYNGDWHSNMAFMEFADTVKLIGGRLISPTSTDVWSYYAGCTTTINAAISSPDTSWFGATTTLANASQLVPASNIFTWNWMLDTADMGWFNHDTSFVPLKYGDYTVQLVGSNVYCNDTVSKTIHVNQGMWSGKTTLPLEAEDRSFAIGASIGDDAYIGMGLNAAGIKLRDLWKYNKHTHRLTRLQDFPFPALRYAEFVSANGKCYLLGGDPGVSPFKSNLFYEYDPSLDAWTQLPDFPGAARAGAQAVVIADNIYMGFGSSDEFYKYHIPTSTWTPLATHPTLSSTNKLLEYQGNILAVSLGSPTSSRIWQYNVSTDTWGLWVSNFTLDARGGANIYLSGSKLWIVSGKVAGTSLSSYLTSSYYYDLNTGLKSPGVSSYVFADVYIGSAFATGFMIGNSYYRCFGECFAGYKDRTIGRYEPNACTNIPFFFPYELDEAGVGIPHTFVSSSNNYLPDNPSGISLIVNGIPVQTGISGTYASATFETCGEKKIQWVISEPGCSDTTTYYQTSHPVFRFEPKAEIPMVLDIRHTMNAFSIGQTGYMGMGNKYVEIFAEAYKDLYAYDPSTDSWTVKSSLPAVAVDHTGSACFTDGTYGYISSGSNGCFGGAGCYLHDTYQYDPVLDSWTARANLPGIGRYLPAAAVVGDTAYAGLGYYPFSGGGQVDKYSFTSNTWTSSGWPYGASMSSTAIAFPYNGKVYTGYDNIGGGGSNPGLYEYDPATGRWSGNVLKFGELRGERFAKQSGTDMYFIGRSITKLDMTRMKMIPIQSITIPGDTDIEFSAAFTIDNQIYISLLNLDIGSPRVGNHFYRYDLDQPVCDFDSLLILGLPQSLSYYGGHELIVLPNPVHDVATIRLSGGGFLEGKIELYDITGKLMLTKECSGREISIDVSDQAPGTYIVLQTDRNVPKRAGRLVIF